MEAITVEPHKKNSVKLSDIPVPTPKEGEALLKVLSVGIDGTDKDINEGRYGEPPSGSPYLIIGHEAVARVQKVSGQVDNISEGDLVVPTVRRPCVEHCRNCQVGESDMCLTGHYAEHGILKLHGFASEYAVTDANFLVKIPEELRDVAVLLEPLSVVEKAVEQAYKVQESRVEEWEPRKVLVLGAGSLGLLATVLLRSKGLEVHTTGTHGSESLKAKLAARVGGKYVNVKETSLNTLKESFDLIIEATGNVESALDAFNLLDLNSLMCIFGIYPGENVSVNFGETLTKMVLGNRLAYGSVSSNKSHFNQGIADINNIQHRFGDILGKLITQKLAPTDYPKIFQPAGENIKTEIRFG